MYFKHIPDIIKPFASDLIFDLPNDQQTIYPTFDDGPHPDITPWVLDQLATSSAKATFFLIGANAKKYPELVERIVAEGHRVGLHGFQHLSGWKTDNTPYFEDLEKAASIISSDLFRPPYGQITMSQAKRLKQNYHLIMWSDLSADFDTGLSPEDCIKHATQKVKPGSIIVFHDSDKAWPRLESCLPACLSYYQEQGFRMEAIPSLKIKG